MQEQTRQAAARGDAAVTPLAELELMPYLDKDGMVAKVDTKGVKASVYAVYDEVRNGPPSEFLVAHSSILVACGDGCGWCISSGHTFPLPACFDVLTVLALKR